MAPKKSTRRPAKQNNYRKKQYKKRASPSGDVMKLTLNNYVEIDYTQGGAAAGGVMAYSLVANPNHMALKFSTNGAGTISANNGTAAGVIADGSELAFPLLAQFKSIYNQYKIDYVKLSISTDKECGLDNPVLALQDKAENTPETSIPKVMTQPHKESLLTENRRTCTYGYRPRTSQEKDFKMCDQPLALGDETALKILQDVEGKANSSCKHRVSITCGITLKDRKSAPLN